jgi:hypothetical protein
MGWRKPYYPIVKKKGFDPAPVAGKIPLYADSKANPRVIGTHAYEEFWDEQFYRCINGYVTAGIEIPGRYYWYLNFNLLTGLKGPMYPYYVDLDLEFFQLVEWVKKHRKTGIIAPKARRKGLSEKAKTILSHGLRFIEGYRGAITAGLDVYQVGLRKKFEAAEAKFHDELRLNALKDNEKMFHVGYERQDPIGGFVDDGYGGRLSFETMYDDPAKLEGEYFHDVILEETGQYKLAGQVVESIKPALEFGSQMLGTFYIYGTGGNILSTSKDFKDFWDNSDSYGLERFWVPGTRLYFPFFGNPDQDWDIDKDKLESEGIEEKFDTIPNLRHLKEHERIGCEDIRAAEDYILKKRAEYAKLPNKKKLKKHNQNYPLTVEEAFTSGGSNNFNDERIYARLFDIEGDKSAWRPVIYDWIYTIGDDGVRRRQTPLAVTVRPAKANDPEGLVVWEYQGPRYDIIDLDVGGIDGYNQDQTQTGKSLGAMVVQRQGNRVSLESEGIHNGRYPVTLYYQRPARKEMFFEVCLMIAVRYRLYKNVMCNAEQDFVIDYFVKNFGIKYLAPRPKSFDAPKSQQVHKYGAKMTSYSKPLMLGVIQSWVEDYVQYCNFPPLLRDLLAYDEEYVGTDWDSVDALGLAEMRIEDMKTRPRQSDSNDYVNDEAQWKFDQEGNAILIENESPEEKKKEKNLTEQRGSWRPGYSYQDIDDDTSKDPFDDGINKSTL